MSADATPAAVASPCIRRCTLDDEDICVGCGRSLEEIRNWSAASPAVQRQILQRCKQRLAQRAARW